MFLWPTALAHWPKPEARRPSALKSSATTAMFGITIINAWLVITTATAPAMTTILAIALGSIATMPSTASAQQQSSSSLRSQVQSNYQGVDAVSAITGLSNGYATPSYMHTYHQLQPSDSAAVPQQYNYHYQPPPAQHPELHDKDSVSTSRVLLRGNGQYVDRMGGRAGGATTTTTTTDALEVFNVPESGFMPTTLTAAGQHYSASLDALTDKTNALGTPPAASKIDLQHSSTAPTTADETTATSYYNMAPTINDNNSGVESATSLYGRLSNYDDLGSAAGRSSKSADDTEGFHNFALAYDNYAANLYNDGQTNGREYQQQYFANYFTPTTSATGRSAYAAATHHQHKYLPLNNYLHGHHHHQQQRQQQQQNLVDKPHIYSRGSSSPLLTPTSSSSLSSSGSSSFSSHLTPSYHDSFNRASNDIDNKHIESTNYQTWNFVDKPIHEDYYEPKQLQGQYQLKEENTDDLKEPETAETSFVVHVSGKKGGKNKSKRSDPEHASYDTYSVSHDDSEGSAHAQAVPSHDLHSHDLHSTIDNTETVEYQQHQLEELQKQLQQQQHQFVTLQHQLIDHDQQLQIHKHHPHYQAIAAHPTLPPVSTTIHHTPHSLKAIAGTPLSKHTHVVRNVAIPQHQQVYVPQREIVNVEVPDPVITTVKKPVPIQIPVSKTIAIPDIKEVKIPIEKLHPFPVERHIPYIVEKRVPYAVEKQIAKPVYYPVPIKVPIVHTVVHKLHTVHPQSYSYQNQNHIPSHPIRYKGHVRHVTHHHGGGHAHYGGGHY